IELQPKHAEAYAGLGSTLSDLALHEEAVGALRRAVGIKPDHKEAYNLLAAALKKVGRRTEAIDCYERALAIDPDFAIVRVNKMHQQAHICDWSSYERDAQAIPALGIVGAPVSPFAMLLREDAPERHRIRAERFAAESFRTTATIAPPPGAKPARLRIGYF